VKFLFIRTVVEKFERHVKKCTGKG
jgi:hypothetical protein